MDRPARIPPCIAPVVGHTCDDHDWAVASFAVNCNQIGDTELIDKLESLSLRPLFQMSAIRFEKKNLLVL